MDLCPSGPSSARNCVMRLTGLTTLAPLATPALGF